MVPVNPIAPVDVLPTESSVKSVLDTVSSEKIDLNTTLYKEGTTDFNKDGTADVLTVATTNTTPLSSFDKLIYNGIVKKISVNLASQATIMIDNFETPFNVLLPYPEQIKEVILALSATMEGDTTNFYIYRKLESLNIKISIIARGVSVGNELEYTDEVTLGRSILNRTPFNESYKLT